MSKTKSSTEFLHSKNSLSTEPLEDCQKQGTKESVREQLENPTTQILILLLVYCDILLSTTEGVATTNDNITTYNNFGVLIFGILAIHAVELIAQFVAFPSRFFEQLGYPLDVLIVASRMAGLGHPHIGFLRVWRLLPLVETLVSNATKHHIETQHELSIQLRNVEELKKKVNAIESDLKKERELRKRNDEMVNRSQEEIETLREALQIAAEEISSNHALMSSVTSDDRSNFGPPAPVMAGEEVTRDLPIRSISPVMESVGETS